MNCSKCNSPLKEGVKFCTSCGTKVESVESVEESVTNTNEGIAVVKSKIVWRIQPSEIARVITESDFAEYKNATGIVINDGTKALIRMDGETIAILKSGDYTFGDREMIEKMIVAKGGKAGSSTGFLANVFGASTKSSAEIEKIVTKAQNGGTFSILLFLDVPFSLIFGTEKRADSGEFVFTPINVKCKTFDLKIALRTLFAITDIEIFAKNYLYDKSSITSNDLAALSQPYIAASIRRVMNGMDINDDNIDDETVDQIVGQIRELSSDSLLGFGIEKLVEISAQNDDIERFRALSQELYLSEREFEYLQRTNDFKNRLSDIENNQTIQEARNDAELFKSLQEVNKDKLLSEAELEKFYLVLSREKKIREAKSEDEIAAALSDIERSGLIRAEDLEILKNQIATDSHQRGYALELMKLKDQTAYDKVRLEDEIDQQRARDAYDDERFNKRIEQNESARRSELKLKSEEEELRLNIEERESRSQMDAFREMAQVKQDIENQRHAQEMASRQQEYGHEENMQNYKMEDNKMKFDAARNLTPEQLMALAANENMGEAAAAEFARSLNSDKVNQVNQARVDDMKDMMREVMAQSRDMANTMNQMNQNSKEEYKERLKVEQQRLDYTQDRAWDYTTRHNNPTTEVQSVVVCKSCGEKNSTTSRFCEKCGSEI